MRPIDWSSALTGIGPLESETDDSLRKRLIYVAADTERRAKDIMTAGPARLDELAAEVGIKRRGRP